MQAGPSRELRLSSELIPSTQGLCLILVHPCSLSFLLPSTLPSSQQLSSISYLPRAGITQDELPLHTHTRAGAARPGTGLEWGRGQGVCWTDTQESPLCLPTEANILLLTRSFQALFLKLQPFMNHSLDFCCLNYFPFNIFL